MNTYRSAVLVLFFATIAAIMLSGCSITGYKADEVHRTISFPGFTDEVHAVGIVKSTGTDGSVSRKAETLTHTTSVAGVTRSATYKGAVLETKSDKP